MPRFYLSPDQCRQPELVLSGREAHHALHVLRIQRGEQVAVLDGAGAELLCQVNNYDRDKLTLSVVEKRAHPPPSCQITLLQALPKGKIVESIIQKATELGVSRIVPLLSERVVMQLAAREVRPKLEKWQQIAIESIKQCGTAWLPQIEAPQTPAQYLARNVPFDLPLLASLQPGASHPRHLFETFLSRMGHNPNSISIWIGPEGDFTSDEIESVIQAGTQPITLGPRVLRSETAAIYCLSILNYELELDRPHLESATNRRPPNAEENA